MSKTLHRKWADISGEICSPTIFKLDLIDSFKYRKSQAWFSLLISLALLSLICWMFSADVSRSNWSEERFIVLALFYLPCLISLLFWFRAWSIYDFSVVRATAEEQFFTKKQARASLIFKTAYISFGFYYCYFWYVVFQIT